ncbi:Hypothetical protein A7982_11127 [Minicystis rosea]|nr:Hypothetical protein A7982_11127 [Minicystis rosea]
MLASLTSRVAAVLRKVVPAMALMTAITCDSLDNFDVSVTGKVTIPAATVLDTVLANALGFAGFDKIDFSQSFANQGVTKDQVDSVHLTAFGLVITAPADGNFDFLDSLSFTVEADGQDSVEIARIDSVPKGQNRIDLDVSSDVDLKPYVVAPSMRIRGEAKGSRPMSETELTAGAVFDVDIHIPGCN